MKNNWYEKLKTQQACSAGLAWASNYINSQAAWNACNRGDWMLWAWSRNYGKIGSKSHRRLVLCCVEIAKTSVKYIKDKEFKRLVKKSLDTTERWARGGEKSVTLEDVKNAAAAVWSAASYAAGAAGAAAAAAGAADAADARYAAGASAVAARSARAAAAGDDSNVVKEKALKKFADMIRTIQSECPKFKRMVTG